MEASLKFMGLVDKIKILNFPVKNGDLMTFTLLCSHESFGVHAIFSVYLISECNLQMQLHELMETLSSTEPHYIRCIKPNSVLKPAIFENTNVLQQLRCSVRKLSHTFLPHSGMLILCCALLTIFHPNRVFLKPLESAVLVIPQGNYSMIFYIASVFLLLRF